MGTSRVSFLLKPTSTPKFGIATASIATLVLTVICPYIYKEEANRHINTNKVLLITIFISPKVVFYCCKDKLHFFNRKLANQSLLRGSFSKMQGSPKINLPLIGIKYRGIVHEELFIGTKETPMVFSSSPTCVSFIMNNPPFHTQNTPVPFNQRHFIHRKRVFSSKNL